MIVLRAIVVANGRAAYVSVDGAEPKRFKAGDAIRKGLILRSLDDDSIVVEFKRQSRRIQVGSEANL